MSGDWLSQLGDLLQRLDPAALHAATFGLLFVEGMGVPGVPGILPMLAQTGLIEAGKTTLLTAIFWGTLGNWLGGLVGYSAGRWGRHWLPERWLQQLDSQQFARWLSAYGPALIVVSRVIGALRTPVTLGAGAAQYSFPGYAALSLLGSLLHVGIWQWLLWRFGREVLIKVKKYGAEAGLVIALALAAAYLLWRWLGRRPLRGSPGGRR